MNVFRIVSSSSRDDVVVRVPSSKSVANRALMIAALAHGESIISHLPDGDDTEAMLSALNDLGVSIEHVNDTTIKIIGPVNPPSECVVDAQLAGTTSRFLLAMCSLSAQPITVTGQPPLLGRPVGELAQALRAIGFTVSPESSQSLPLTVSAPQHLDNVTSEVTIRGDISSQFISALMMIGPALPKGLRIKVDGNLVSRSYVVMTAQVMTSFGAHVDVEDDVITVHPQKYVATEFAVEPDYSSAAFPIVAAVLSGRNVCVPGLAQSHLQGDSRIIEIVKSMGAEVVTKGDDVLVSHNEGLEILPITIDMSDCSDLVPAVATLATFANGITELTGIGFIAAKESDRLRDLATELERTGARVEVIEDGVRIHPAGIRQPALLSTHHDHRLAMSFALLGLRIPGIEIRDPQVVSKSWPRYWNAMSPFFSARTPRHSTVAFDLDKTLTVRDCVMPFFVRSTGWWRFMALALRNIRPISSHLRRRDRDGLKELAVRLIFAGRDVGEVEHLGDQFAAHVSKRWMREDTCSILKWHQQNGDDVVLVTASIAPYVMPLARLIEIPSVLCSEMEIQDGKYTGELTGGNCRGAEKARRLAEWLEGRHLDYAYGDSAGDNAMLAMSSHPTRVGRRDVKVHVVAE